MMSEIVAVIIHGWMDVVTLPEVQKLILLAIYSKNYRCNHLLVFNKVLNQMALKTFDAYHTH